MMERIDKHRFWLGAVMMTAGITMLFIAMFIDPRGVIDGTILGAFGEIATIAGAILGLDSYVNFKMRKMFDQREKETNEE